MKALARTDEKRTMKRRYQQVPHLCLHLKGQGEPAVCPLERHVAMALPKVTFLLGKHVLRLGGQLHSHVPAPSILATTGTGQPGHEPGQFVGIRTAGTRGGAAAGAEPWALLAREPQGGCRSCMGFHPQQVHRDQRYGRAYLF